MIRAFSKQIDELLQVFQDLNELTTLETATGQSLRYIGDILSMSIKDAQAIVRVAKEQEITDETYRKVLKYKAIQNNCDCTYYDIMDAFALLWDISNVKYVEKLEKPATIYIELPETSIDGKDPAVERVLAIKPAGVAMIYFAEYVTGVNLSGIEKARLPNIRMATTGANIKEIVIPNALIRGKIENEEESLETMAIFYKSYWLLDGTYSLDGTKILAAEKWEEVL